MVAIGLAVSLKSLASMRVMAALAAAWIGFCLLPIHGALFGTEMLIRPAYGTYQARVDEILSETQSEKRVILSAIAPLGDSRALPIRRARVLVRSGPDLSPGDVIEGPFRFAPVPGPIYPGGFDTQFHAYFDGIGSYGNSTQPPAIVRAGSETTPEHMVDAVRRGGATRAEALSSLFQLVVAGHDTTSSLIGNGVVALLDHPDQLALLRDDPGLVRGAVEELLRYTAAVPHATFRVTTEAVELGGVTVPAGRQDRKSVV